MTVPEEKDDPPVRKPPDTPGKEPVEDPPMPTPEPSDAPIGDPPPPEPGKWATA